MIIFLPHQWPAVSAIGRKCCNRNYKVDVTPASLTFDRYILPEPAMCVGGGGHFEFYGWWNSDVLFVCFPVRLFCPSLIELRTEGRNGVSPAGVGRERKETKVGLLYSLTIIVIVTISTSVFTSAARCLTLKRTRTPASLMDLTQSAWPGKLKRGLRFSFQHLFYTLTPIWIAAKVVAIILYSRVCLLIGTNRTEKIFIGLKWSS